MAEEAAVKAPAAKEAGAAPAKGGIAGPALAVVVLLAIGGGVGWFVASLPAFQPHAEAEPEKHGGEHAADGADAKKKGNALADLHEIQLNDLISNVRNQGGRRYVKVSCAIWVEHHDHAKIVPPAEEGGHGPAKENETIKRILRMRLEEHLKGYDMDDLTAPNIYSQLANGFRDAIEREMGSIYTDVGADYRYVKRIVLTSLLVQ